MTFTLIAIPLLCVLALNLPLWGSLRNRLALGFGIGWCLVQGLGVILAPFVSCTGPCCLAGLADALLPADNLSRVMFLAIAIVGFAALMVGRSTLVDEGRRFNFVNLLLLAMAGMNGVVLARDLFSLYIFLEVTAVSSFVLIVLDRGRDAFEGAFKYIVLSALATAMILSSIAILLMTTGGVATLTASPLSFENGPDAGMTLVAAALLLGGLFIKSGLVPFHGWLPDAYSSAPDAVSVLLAGIVTKTTGVYALIRVVTVLFPRDARIDTLLLGVGALSVVVGALAAMGQDGIKRMLAYSSISQVGYIILGLGASGAADPKIAALGLAGAVLHLFNHSVFKSLLFSNAAAVIQQAGTQDMRKMGGIAERMPVTGWTSIVGFLSTAGIPPFSGFWSKLMIIVALWASGNRVVAAVAILASLLTLAYFLLMQRKVFFGKLAPGLEKVREADVWITVSCVLLAGITIVLGVCIPWLFMTFLLPIGSFL